MSADMRDDDGPVFDQPDADEVYALYLETRNRLGVVPVSRERANGLIAEGPTRPQ